MTGGSNGSDSSLSWSLHDPYYILRLHYFVVVWFGKIKSLLHFKNILTFSFAFIQCLLTHMDVRFDDAVVCVLSVSNLLNKPAVLPRWDVCSNVVAVFVHGHTPQRGCHCRQTDKQCRRCTAWQTNQSAPPDGASWTSLVARSGRRLRLPFADGLIWLVGGRENVIRKKW